MPITLYVQDMNILISMIDVNAICKMDNVKPTTIHEIKTNPISVLKYIKNISTIIRMTVI